MLSNPTTTNLQNRQRQHRRQNSTPTAFDALKVASLPSIQRRHAHRRGMSLDQHRPEHHDNYNHRHVALNNNHAVSITNPQGYPTTPQHILRETQQHRLARPGRPAAGNGGHDEDYLHSPLATPQRQSFDPGSLYGSQTPSSHYGFPEQGNEGSPFEITDFRSSTNSNYSIYSTSSMTPSAFAEDYMDPFGSDFPSGLSSKRSSFGRRISGGIAERVHQYETLAMQAPVQQAPTNQRPVTPPYQNVQAYFPLTPADTPYGRVKYEQVPSRFADNHDESMEMTIKPKSGPRARGIFDEMRQAAAVNSIPSPPNTAPLPFAKTFDSAPMPIVDGSLTQADIKQESLSGMLAREHIESVYPASETNVHAAPSATNLPPFQDPFAIPGELDAGRSGLMTSNGNDVHQSSSPHHKSHRRSESVSTINLDETITETGITIDDIAEFISGPDADGKWICLFPDCDKKFGRKENIKSHVQTHLGDRQYQCPHCKKCFVRQHDLKRHAKIHSGVKPYPCQCGNSFARHDALTRHRQRGMCIGAFEGIVKKTVKRGRPRKIRPDQEERSKKSAKTRAKNKVKSSTASGSGSSATGPLSPRSDVEDILDDKPLGDLDFSRSISSTITDNSDFQYAQGPSLQGVDCISMKHLHGHPMTGMHGTFSTYTSGYPLSHPNSPAKSMNSQYHSPPELVDVASPPGSNFYQLDGGAHHENDMLVNLSGLTHLSEHDDAMFLKAFTATDHGFGMAQLDRDPTLLLDRFDDSFTNGAMFGDHGEVFFDALH